MLLSKHLQTSTPSHSSSYCPEPSPQQLPPATPSSQPLPASPRCLLSEQQPRGHIIHVTPLLQTPLPTSFTVKAKVPMVAYWSVPPLNIVLAFSLWLCFSYICLLGIPWICQGNSHFLPLYKLSQWLEWSVPTVCTAISFTPFKPLIK